MAGRSDIQAGRSYVELYVKNSLFMKGMAAAKKSVTDMGAGLMKWGGMMTAGGGGILAPLAGAVKMFADMGSELADMSARTGKSVGSLAELKFAAEQTGTSLEDVEKAIRMSQKNGLNFDKVADRIAGIADPAERTRAALEAWGKSGTALLPMLNDLKALKQEARDLNLVPTEQAVSAADKIGDLFDKISFAPGDFFPFSVTAPFHRGRAMLRSHAALQCTVHACGRPVSHSSHTESQLKGWRIILVRLDFGGPRRLPGLLPGYFFFRDPF